jgi:outer membrane protein
MAFAAGFTSAFAQDSGSLSLDEALRLAKDRNGTVRSAMMQVKSADASVTIASAAFLPTVNAQLQYNSNRQQFVTTGTNTAFAQTEGNQTFLNTSWTLLDSGQRDFGLRSAQRARDSRQFNAKQVLRTTLFSVVQQYYDTLRSQELERVALTQVDRARTILDQTQTRIKARDAAQIEELQANADYQNARVTALTAKNSETNAEATLKGTIGFSASDHLPKLTKDEAPITANVPESLQSLILEGLQKRPDILAQQKNIESERYSKLLADRNAGITMNLSASYIEQMSPISLQNRSLTFLVGIPIFDGGSLKAQARQISYSIKADESSLEQAQRVVRAEIEAAYVELKTNAERLQAAQTALDAAKKNYEAAVDSQKAGAYDLLQVITAQLSLVTAESNEIQAMYDYRISDVNLRLVTGRPIPGE